MSPKSRKSSSRDLRAGGSIVTGDVRINNGTFVGRDNIQNNAPALKELFQPVYQKILDDKTLSEDDKKEVHELVKDVEHEVAENEQPNDRLLSRLFKDIKKMTPEILQVVSATLTNPAAGLTLAVQKIINKALQEASV